MLWVVSDRVLTGWLLLTYSSVMRLLIFPRSTMSLRRPLGLRRAKIGLACLENGKVVMIPYLCRWASFTVISHLRLIGVGRLWPKAGLSSFGVSFTSMFTIYTNVKTMTGKNITKFNENFFNFLLFVLAECCVSPVEV